MVDRRHHHAAAEVVSVDLLLRDARGLGPQLALGAHEIWEAFPLVPFLVLLNTILICAHYFLLFTTRMAGGGSIFQVEWLAVLVAGYLFSVIRNWEDMDIIDQRCS